MEPLSFYFFSLCYTNPSSFRFFFLNFQHTYNCLYSTVFIHLPQRLNFISNIRVFFWGQPNFSLFSFLKMEQYFLVYLPFHRHRSNLTFFFVKKNMMLCATRKNEFSRGIHGYSYKCRYSFGTVIASIEFFYYFYPER